MATKTSKMEKSVEAILETVIFIKEKAEGIDERVDDLGTKVDKIGKKLDVFAKHEVGERVQLGERVDNIEKHLGFKKPTVV